MLYQNASAATSALRQCYEDWTGHLTSWSMQLSYAVLAANWAVFGTSQKLLASSFASMSISFVVLSLCINLIWAKILSDRVEAQIKHAEQDRDRWEKEFIANSNDDDWPFTKEINRDSRVVRQLRLWIPLAAGAAFVMAVLCNLE